MSKPAVAANTTNLVGQPVRKMNCHAGVILNGLAVSSLHHTDHKCDMHVTPVGVHVTLHKHTHRPAAVILVPWANIYFVELFGDDAPAAVKGAA